jgi:DNA-binding transcriptional MocR family regulator
MDFQLAIAGLRPLTRQIYDQIRSAVLDGRLRRGERLPATRQLANQLNISRKTVVLAYDMLLLFPGLRVGFTVSPQPLRSALVSAKHLTDWHSPLLAQAAVATFIGNGHFARHIRKVRRLYSDRRNQLIAEIQRSFSDWLAILPSGTGLHMAATLKQNVTADAVATAALAAGIRVFPIPDGIAFGIGTIEASQNQRRHGKTTSRIW